MKTGVHGILTIVLWSLFLALRVEALSADAAQSRLSPAASDERTMQTELLEAAVSGSTDRLTELLRRGVSPSVRDENGFTPLYICAASGNAAGVEALLAAGADPDFGTNDETPLDIAVINDHVEVVRQLLAAGAKTETSVREQGAEVPVSAALANAAAVCGFTERVKTLLARGADVNGRSRRQETALQYAAEEGHLEAVKVLIEAGADIDAQDAEGW
ncbi:MAG: ankyrin repeat domain-containing protein, partial [Pyramidobacter sp.]|nr:ankyrin repeat domain-containing protein [Pyramidobacter sp.]